MIRIHPTAEVSPRAIVGDGAQIWNQVQVREDAHIGRNCILGKGVYIDFGVSIGDNCKLQNGAFVYHGTTLEDGVFVGPGALLTNDKLPRAINPDGSLKLAEDWAVGKILVRRGASLGAGCIILPGVVIGEFAMVAAGAVVTRNVLDQALAVGTPARQIGYVCFCGHRLTPVAVLEGADQYRCNVCRRQFELPPGLLERNSP